jgi:hypothetical protein
MDHYDNEKRRDAHEEMHSNRMKVMSIQLPLFYETTKNQYPDV